MTKRRNRRTAEELARVVDLFGEIPVTAEELRAWVRVIAPAWFGSRAEAAYIRDWNVADKIRRAKTSGEWPSIAEQAASSCPHCGRSGPRH